MIRLLLFVLSEHFYYILGNPTLSDRDGVRVARERKARIEFYSCRISKGYVFSTRAASDEASATILEIPSQPLYITQTKLPDNYFWTGTKRT